MTLKRVGGSETRLAHSDQVKRFIFSKETPRELRRRNEPARPSAGTQKKILKRIRRDLDGEEVDSDTEVVEDDEFVDDLSYDLEAILGHFHTKDGFWFLVRYAGFPNTSWEHESLIDAPKMVTTYFKEVCQGDS